MIEAMKIENNKNENNGHPIKISFTSEEYNSLKDGLILLYREIKRPNAEEMLLKLKSHEQSSDEDWAVRNQISLF